MNLQTQEPNCDMTGLTFQWADGTDGFVYQGPFKWTGKAWDAQVSVSCWAHRRAPMAGRFRLSPAAQRTLPDDPARCEEATCQQLEAFLRKKGWASDGFVFEVAPL